MLWQPSIPDVYTRMAAADLASAITRRREALGPRLVILGHHYQTDEVIQHADITGDSLLLSQRAAQLATKGAQGGAPGGAEYVIFCGVHFMAETADMLTPDSVKVILPDLSAGCSMADMAQYDDTVAAWDALHQSLADSAGPGGWRGRIIPITYINSSAAIKAFVGERGGIVCTSSNAALIFKWAMAGGTRPVEPGEEIKLLFLPDQHLGRNTAAAYGIDVAAHTCLYDPRLARKGEPLGGATAAQVRDAKVILWAGHCSVHKLFRPEHCDQIRAMSAAEPDALPYQILVHPECAKEVVDKADLAGSTEFIIRTIRNAAPGTRWAIGTENHLVNRLVKEAATRGVHARILSDCQCLCTTMYRIDQPHLLWVLDHLTGDPDQRLSSGGASKGPRVVNQISVLPRVRELGLLAIDRMLEVSKAQSVAPAAKAAAAL